MDWRAAARELRSRAAREGTRFATFANQYRPARATVVPLVVIFVLLGVLASLAGMFAQAYHAEKYGRAARYFEAGRKLAAEGRSVEAAEQFRAALTLSRENEDYKLALASSLVDIGRPGEAQAYLKELLQTDPTQGLVNLMMARLVSQAGDAAAAEMYFNRAIYGYWPRDEQANRTSARFELIELLLRQGANRNAVGEMMQMQADIANDPVLEKRVGSLYLKAGAAVEAAETFQRVIRRDRRDSEAYAGLGDAHLSNRNFAAARLAYANALRFSSEDQTIRARYELADEANRLDPTLPRLRAAERYSRSRALVQRALAEVERCSSDVKLLEQGREAAKGRRRGQDYNDAEEANLALFDRLIEAARRACGDTYELPRPLAFIQAKLKPESGADLQPPTEPGSATP